MQEVYLSVTESVRHSNSNQVILVPRGVYKVTLHCGKQLTYTLCDSYSRALHDGLFVSKTVHPSL